MSSEVQFDEDTLSNASRIQSNRMAAGNSEQPKLIRWMIDHGIARSPEMANGILIAAIVINLIITFVIVTYVL